MQRLANYHQSLVNLSSNSRQMFSRSFVSSIKSPQDVAADIARRALPTNKTVRRPPTTSGEHLYTYEHDGFRTFRGEDQGNHAENLVKDFHHFMKGEGNNTTLPYHYAITALHHTQITHQMARFANQTHIMRQLAATPSTTASTTTASTPASPPQPDYTLSRHLLDQMKYALPQHPKTLVVIRPDGHSKFDPANVPPERTFIKKCCEEPSSADTCRCHVNTSHESVQYTNALGECITVCYFSRKNEFFNTTYRMWHNPSDDDAVPHSPSDEVSESEIFPTIYDHEFVEEMVAAETATAEGFTHVWKNKSHKRRFERRQRRRQQLASGELPKYGLILVILDTEETRASRPHPIAGHDDERRQLYKASYEKIRDAVQTRAIKQGLIAPTPAPNPAPAPEIPDHLLLPPFLARRKIQPLQQQQAIVNIQRPLSDSTLTIAHSVARAQVTAISALHPHQRLRTVAGSLISLLALRLGCERTSLQANVNQHLHKYRDQHNLHNLHYDAIHRILRRSSGSQARAIQITAPYTEYATILQENIPTEQHAYIKKYMATRFQSPPPITPESIFGPNSFHRAEFFANKCLELIGNPSADPTADPISASRWAKLRADVQRVRRGELTAYQVIADPGPANDYWVYAIKNTFHHAIQNYLSANTEWMVRHDRPSRFSEGRKHINTEKGESIYWPNSKDIRINASRVVQTTLMIRAMYRFVVRASCVLSPEFVGVFGYNMRFIKVLISRAKYLATCDGDEASAITFGHFFPCLMTPDVHLDIFVGGNVFQEPDLYVKMSDPVLGPLKKHFKYVIPSRHTGTIDRATLERPITIRNRE